MKFEELKQHIIDDWAAHAEWRREAREDFAFFAGDQWTPKERKALENAGRAAVTFNRTAPIIDSVIGSEINNRTEVRFIPRELGDAGVNEMLTNAAQWFRDEADAEEEESDSFQDTLICGLGWVYTRLSNEDGPEGEPEIIRCDPLEVGWDRSATRRNLRDMRRVFWARRMPLAEAREMFPGKSRETLNADWFPQREAVSDNDDDPGRQYEHGGESRPADKDEVTIVQVQWRTKETYYVAKDPQSGERMDLTKAQADHVRKLMPYVQMVPAKRSKFHQAFLGSTLLEQTEAPNQADFDFQAITGKRDRNARRWYGLMRAMKDPQRWANKHLITTMHIMGSNSKGGIIAEAGLTENHAKFEEDWARPDSVHWVEDGALSSQRILPKPQATFPAGYDRLTEFSVSSIRDTTGVSQEMLGLRDANQPGVLEYQRRQSAMTILAKLFDSLRAYRKRQGRVLLYYITEYLSDGRLVRIVGDSGEKYLPLVRDESVRKYDIIVDDAPSSPNQKEMTWAFVQQLLPMIGPLLGPEEWSLILKHSPLPESFTTKLEKIRSEPDEGAQMQQQMQQMAAQLEMKEKQVSIAKDEAEIAKRAADIEKTRAEISRIPSEIDENEAQTAYIAARAANEMTNGDLAPAKFLLDAESRLMSGSPSRT